ncbi:hypothetical protein [Bartonella sp. TS82HLJMH]|uniref:hypothetical protein n=1 Tax=Bartonella sp. TS82HLJMH TaxID=3243577 RepID=UPI0035D0DF41
MSWNLVVLKVQGCSMLKESFVMGGYTRDSVFMVFIFSFALKDDEISIGGCYFTGSDEKKIKFPFEEGIKVVALGRLTNFPVLSNRQIIMKALCY